MKLRIGGGGNVKSTDFSIIVFRSHFLSRVSISPGDLPLSNHLALSTRIPTPNIHLARNRFNHVERTNRKI